MLRKVVTALILIPLAVVIIAFAVANRQIVTVSLDPFSPAEPAASVTLPLFAMLLGVLIVGVVIGGAAAWLRQSQWRQTARRLDREVRDLRAKVDSLEATAGEATVIPRESKPPEPLKLNPLVR